MDCKIRNERMDCVKGILELLIILEHNAIITANYTQIRPVVNGFCVGCFLLITFLRPIKNIGFFEFSNKYFKYLITYFVFITFASILNSITFSELTLSQQINAYLMSIFYQSSYFIKQSSGFAFFWFLPCLCFLYLLRFIHLKIGWVFIVFSMVATLLIGMINPKYLVNLPFSAHVALYLYFLGVCYAFIHSWLCNDNIIGLVSFIAFVFLVFINSIIPPSQLLFAGIIPSIGDGYIFFYYVSLLLLAFPALYYFANFIPSAIRLFLAVCGRYSLWLYLIHQFYYVFFTKIWVVSQSGFVVYLYTIILSLISAYVIENISWLKSYLLPRQLMPIKSS